MYHSGVIDSDEHDNSNISLFRCLSKDFLFVSVFEMSVSLDLILRSNHNSELDGGRVS